MKERNGNTRGYREKLNLTPYLPKRNNNNATRKHKQNTLERILARRKITDEEIRMQIAERILLENTFGEKWTEARSVIYNSDTLPNNIKKIVEALLDIASHIKLSHEDFELAIKPYSLNSFDSSIVDKIRATLAAS